MQICLQNLYKFNKVFLSISIKFVSLLKHIKETIFKNSFTLFNKTSFLVLINTVPKLNFQ